MSLRILTLCYEWPPVGGGGGQAAKDVAEVLVKRGYRVRVQTIRLGAMPRRQLENSVEVFRTWGFRRRADRCTPWEMAGYIVTSVGPTLGHLREFRPDLVHAHFAVPSGALAFAVARLFHVPYVITAHLGDVPGGVPEQTAGLFTVLNPLIRPIWRRAAEITAVSAHVAQMAEAAYGRRPIVIPNGISLRDRPPIPEKLNEPPKLIFVGRFNPQKNLPFLIRVLRDLAELPWTLELIGDGAERVAVQTMVRAADLAGRVQFSGWLPREQVENRLAQADIFVLPSTVEGQSVAALEAARAGLALVGSDIAALRTTVASGRNGLLIKTNDPDAWTGSLRGLLNDGQTLLQLRRANWQRAAEFDLEKATDQYEAVFARACLAQRPGLSDFGNL